MEEQIQDSQEQGIEPQTAEQRMESFLEVESSEEPTQTEEETNEEMDEEVSAEADATESDEEVTEEEAEEVTEEELEESVEDEPQTWTVKASGEEKQVTIDELIKNYQLGADYTKKTQDLAQQRQQVEQNMALINESAKMRDYYAQGLQEIEKLLVDTEDESSLEELREKDPIQYAVKVAELSQNKKKIDAIRAEQQKVAQAQQHYQQQQLAQQVSEETRKLSELLPDFSHKEKGEQLKNQIRAFGLSQGFTDQELAQVYDSRHVLVLHKAMKYDQLMKNKAKTTKKVADAPKMAKSKAKMLDTKSQAYKNQRKALRDSGDSNVAVSVFESILNN